MTGIGREPGGRESGDARAAHYQVGPPRAGEAAALGSLHCRVWQVTYRDLMTPQAYAALTPEGFAAGWQRRLDTLAADGVLPQGEQVLVARHDGAPVAFVSVGEPRDDEPPAPRQLWALNVLPEHQGTGLADRLMTEGLGDGAAYLWVAKGNARAIRFYQRHGFALDGVEAADQHDGIVEQRMVRAG